MKNDNAPLILFGPAASRIKKFENDIFGQPIDFVALKSAECLPNAIFHSNISLNELWADITGIDAFYNIKMSRMSSCPQLEQENPFKFSAQSIFSSFEDKPKSCNSHMDLKTSDIRMTLPSISSHSNVWSIKYAGAAKEQNLRTPNEADWILKIVSEASNDSNLEKTTTCTSGLPMHKPVIKKATRSRETKKTKFCNCCLNQQESLIVKRVMTSNNIEYLLKLQEYDYRLKEQKLISGKPSYVYVCNFKGDCNREFERSWNLLDHCRMHMGIKPHKCEVCGKSFTQKGNLNKHLITHNQ